MSAVRCPGVLSVSDSVDHSASSVGSAFRDNACAGFWKDSLLGGRGRRMQVRIVEYFLACFELNLEIARRGWGFWTDDEARRSDIERGCGQSSYIFGNVLLHILVLSSKRGRRSMP